MCVDTEKTSYTMEQWDTLEEVAGFLEEEFACTPAGTATHRLLKFKRDELRKLISKAIEVATLHPAEVELYRLADTRDQLQAKIHALPRRPPSDHPDVKELAEVKDQIRWVQETKLKGVVLTPVPKPQTPLR